MRLLLWALACGIEGDKLADDSSAVEGDTDSDTDTDSDGDADTDSDTDTGPPPSVDADNDGYTSDTDCDDSDPETYPSAPDVGCDEIDRDCDGVSWSAGSCGEDMAFAEFSESIPKYQQATGVPDLTGDGRPDIILEATDAVLPDGSAGNAYHVFQGDGTFPAEGWTWQEDSLHGYSMGESVCLTEFPKPVGDLDGDGVGDLLFVSHLCWDIMHIQVGPVPDDGETTWVDALEHTWTSPTYGTGWMYSTAWGGDFDGDGRSDMVGIGGGAAVVAPGYSAFEVFMGGTWGETQIRVMTNADQSATDVDVVGDLDGDGIPEVHVYEDAPGHAIISGADLPGANGAYVSDLAFAIDDENGTYSYLDDDDSWRACGDWTGDGLDDLLVSTAMSSSTGARHHGEVLILDGSSVDGAFTMDDAIGSWVGEQEDGEAHIDQVLDLDGDGADEVMIVDHTETGDAAWRVLPHVLPALHTPVTDWITLTGPGYAYGRGAPLDFDQDGDEDWFFTDFTDHDNPTDNLMRGWPIPWDEPSAW